MNNKANHTTPNHYQIINSAKRTLEAEITGLQALPKNIMSSEFCQAVEAICHTSGKVIISGMGKSGHIARKIAATLASTGTASFFVHPAEASHGDLGMICEGDLLILLSNSGETAELRDIVQYAKNRNIQIIAMVRRARSMLVSQADIALVLPNEPEACNHIKAPTTSTTMMLALGDALAIASMEQKQFSNHDFGIFHPGGKLGSAFAKISEIMHGEAELPLVKPNDNMKKTLLAITSGRFGCTGIIDNSGELIGIITDGDLRRHINGNLLEKTAQDIMTKTPLTIQPDLLVSEALKIMNEHSITSLFVTENQSNTSAGSTTQTSQPTFPKPIGIVHIHDCIRIAS